MSLSPARAVLIAGSAITAVAFISLISILVFYFAGLAPHRSVYFAALWGFPAGFALMIAHVLLGLRHRRSERA